MEQLITIDVFGQSYTFKADAGITDPKVVAEFLTQEVRKIDAGQSSSLAGNSQFVLLLQAALNISSEHMHLKQQLTEMSNRISEQTERLYSLLESSGHPMARQGPVAG
ncbi:MAG: cell division protein ZapA [Desulfosarcina sp.]|nr:cell division protein ZapA [Desulfobacterales bacterium]